MKKINNLVYLFAVLAMIFWSMSFVWFKVVFEVYKPFTVVFLRLVISGTLLVIWSKLAKKSEKIKKEDWKLILLLAFSEPFCYFLGESFGMQYVSATLGSIIISMIPIVTPIFSLVFFREKISPKLFLSLFLSFIGVYLIVGGTDGLQGNMKGILLMLFAVLSGTSYGFIVRKVAKKYSSITIVKLQSIIGALYFLPFFLIFEANHFIHATPTPRVIATILQLAILPSTLSFILFTRVIREIGIYRSNMFTNLIPVFTAVFSFFVLHEVFSVKKIIGILIVVSCLFLSQISFTKLKLWLHDW